MNAQILLVMLSLGALVLSGCITSTDDADPHDPAGDDVQSTPEPTDVNETADEEPAPAPTSVPVSLTASNVSGESPFTVTFNLSSEASNARFLDWSLDADGDETADKTGYGLPAEAVFTFEQAGNYTARLTVTDPEERTGNATIDVQVTAPPEVILPDPVTFSGTITGVSDNMGGYIIGSAVEHEFNLTVPVTNFTVTFENSETALDLDFDLIRPDGEEADSRASANEPTGLLFGSSEDPILVDDPADLAVLGTWVIVVHPYLSIEGDYTITVTFA